jgi:hypothetical protein
MPFRRRFPPRRIPRRPFRRPGARQAIQALRRAHQHLEQGEYIEAAEIFERLAAIETQRGSQGAPNLHFQAARARLSAGQVEEALLSAQTGLKNLLAAGRYQRFAAAEHRILSQLENRGYKEQAEQLRAELETLKAGKPIPSYSAPASKVKLPSKCPYCGGNILPDEVEWLDETTPGCSYCGSPLQSKA